MQNMFYVIDKTGSFKDLSITACVQDWTRLSFCSYKTLVPQQCVSLQQSRSFFDTHPDVSQLSL